LAENNRAKNFLAEKIGQKILAEKYRAKNFG
jgi:hypothetical protein